MNTGTARYQGQTVVFTDAILNQWANRMEFLISYNGQLFWVRDDELTGIQYQIGKRSV